MNVFVYGTLRPTQPLFNSFEDSYTAILKGTIKGKLLDLGAFPGLVEGDGIVHGEVIMLKPSCARMMLAVLDRIEGVSRMNKYAGLYRREVVNVCTTEGSMGAFVYVYNNNRTWPSPVIECGDWAKYSASREINEDAFDWWGL